MLYSKQIYTDGYFSFGRDIILFISPRATSHISISASSFTVAPFWANIDLRVGGSVNFQVYTSANGSTKLEQVSQVINDREGTFFNGTWMLIAQWTEVARRHGNSNVVRLKATIE